VKLAKAVNLDTRQEMHRLRSKARAGLHELQQRGYLEAFELTKENQVVVSKARDTAVNFDSQIMGGRAV
jgi:hypothetical protein